jgi:hypothetical protein
MAIGVVVFFVLLRRRIRAPATFLMDSEGFELSPAGVHLGRFRGATSSNCARSRWSPAATAMVARRSNQRLGVMLKDPDAYTA